MADLDGAQKSADKEYYLDIEQKNENYTLKGSGSLDWGMKNRLSRIFNPESGKTVMLAFDHGYFQGPTTGLERIDVSISPLYPYADVLMLTRGVLRSLIPASISKAICMRASGGTSMLTPDLSDEFVAVDIEDSIRMNVSAITTQVFIGADPAGEKQSLKNLTQLIDTGARYGIPTLAVTAVGKDMERNARYFGLATRICAELGAHFVKTYFVEEGFEKVCAACPVPIVIAGGKKRPELDALQMAYKAIDQGALGVDMGRNIFQSENPVAMIQAVRAVVHGGEKPEKGFDLYNTLKNEKN